MRSVEYNDNCKEVLPKDGVDVVAFDRIMVDPDKMGRAFCRGLRIFVATVVGMVADGMGEEEILKAYPDLERKDVRETLQRTVEGVAPLNVSRHCDST